MTIKEIETHSLKNKNKKLIILDKKFNFSKAQWLSQSLTLFLLGGGSLMFLFLIYYYRKRKGSIRTQVKEVTDWKKILIEARVKEDFITIYENKNKWIELIVNKEALEAFLNCAKDSLFKRELVGRELEELRSTAVRMLKEREE